MPIGSGIWQGLELTSSVVVVQLKSDHVSAFSNALANRNRPILPLSKGDRIEFVLRTIDPSEDHAMVEAFWPAS